MTSTSSDWLTAVARAIEQADEAEVIVDLSAVQMIASSDLSELIRLQLAARQLGRRMILQNPQVNVLEVFTLTRLDRLIELRHEGQSTLYGHHFDAAR
ncbi:STAS domain-containing protein [Novipirellula artificiosorum]|uniref:STAS domain-containing protein n=1 Tax=Novipirellula artificiosorum TaxID=2528016 RepID=UPI0018CF1C20|nr:STAS domain-containing protein [Novipirellula artificiosorum]